MLESELVTVSVNVALATATSDASESVTESVFEMFSVKINDLIGKPVVIENIDYEKIYKDFKLNNQYWFAKLKDNSILSCGYGLVENEFNGQFSLYAQLVLNKNLNVKFLIYDKDPAKAKAAQDRINAEETRLKKELGIEDDTVSSGFDPSAISAELARRGVK